MAKEFKKKIHGKPVKVTPVTHKVLGGDAWGVQTYCPWCSKTLVSHGAPSPKSAAELIFHNIEQHWKHEHKDK